MSEQLSNRIITTQAGEPDFRGGMGGVAAQIAIGVVSGVGAQAVISGAKAVAGKIGGSPTQGKHET